MPPFWMATAFSPMMPPKHFIIAIFYWRFLIAKPPPPFMVAPKPWYALLLLNPPQKQCPMQSWSPIHLTQTLWILQKELNLTKCFLHPSCWGALTHCMKIVNLILSHHGVVPGDLNTISLILSSPCFISLSDSEIVGFLKVMTEFPVTTILNYQYKLLVPPTWCLCLPFH